MMGLPSLALKKEKRQIERVVALKCSGLPLATPKKTPRLSCFLKVGVNESSFQAARLSSKQHRLIS
jgi:hypothetical protein